MQDEYCNWFNLILAGDVMGNSDLALHFFSGRRVIFCQIFFSNFFLIIFEKLFVKWMRVKEWAWTKCSNEGSRHFVKRRTFFFMVNWMNEGTSKEGRIKLSNWRTAQIRRRWIRLHFKPFVGKKAHSGMEPSRNSSRNVNAPHGRN